ncbi:hypothetical protein BJV82DRAFT_488283, partial [Fennellomyces sp. T-0311]
GIRYLWFDQMCIDPTDEKDKTRTLQEIHMIYRHALCTIALIPELRREKDSMESYNMMIANSEWNKRAWTLAEAYHSCNILYLGRDVHIWRRSNHAQAALHDSRTEHFLLNISCRTAKDWSASTILWWARQRTSSRPNDRIYALLNMY